jgi:hypothetical protein
VRGLAPSDEGKRMLRDDSSIHPLERGEGRRTATHDAVARERATALRHCPEKKEKDARWAMGQSGWVGRMPLGPVRRENKEKNEMDRKDDWAKMENQLRI